MIATVRSHFQVRWMIQTPRLYDTHRKDNSVASFQQMLDNIVMPLFEVREVDDFFRRQ